MPHFSELRHILSLRAAEPAVRYSRMLSLLRLICIDESAKLHADFSTLFSRLYAVCQAHSIPHQHIDRMRRRARRVLFDGYRPTLAQEQADAAALAAFIAALAGVAVPDDLPKLQEAEEEKEAHAKTKPALENFRAVVTSIDEKTFCVLAEGETFVVKPADDRILRLLEKGVVVSLVDLKHEANVLHATTVVLEPDFLLDVSALCACLKPYGHSPLNYLLSKFSPAETTIHILLGNAANQMMDNCINDLAPHNDAAGGEQDAVYRRAIRENYRQYVLDFAALPPEQLTGAFLDATKLHFENIRSAVTERFPAKDVDIQAEKVVLEPAFLCPALGLRARFDVMTEDMRRIVELKSGRAVEQNTPDGLHVALRSEHLMQMNLYREILRVNFHQQWDEVRAFLFYSRYPEFFNERPSAAALRDIVHLRNRIVAMERTIMKGGIDSILPYFTPEVLNERGIDDKFYHNFLYPQIAAVTTPLAAMDALTRAYFTTFVTFMAREQFMAKTTDLRPDSQRGFAATWTADLTTKLLAGNILIDLRLDSSCLDKAENVSGIERLEFLLPDYGDRFIPNFNTGEMVQLYVRNAATDNVTNRQLTRAYIETLTAERLVLRLAYPQRNRHLFALSHCYAIEHDYSDAPFSQAYRGLFALVKALPERRALVLAQQAPSTDTTKVLLGNYDERTAAVTLKAKQANDYFLLVGPPGTGKTNVALKAMVEEHLLSMAAEGTGGLLLMAYTNRAVDEICGMLQQLATDREERSEPPFDYVRLGSANTCAEEFRPHLLSERALLLPKCADARRFLQSVPIVVGTVMGITSAAPSLFALRRFATAIIDEASQLIEPFALTLLSANNGRENAIEKFVFIGDHKQLPAVVMLPPEQTAVTNKALQDIGLTDLRNSLFERLHKVQTMFGTEADIVAQLNRHGRMHPDICSFVNRHFYDNQLEAVPLPHQSAALTWQHAEGKYEAFVAAYRVGCVNVVQEEAAENVRANLPEAHVVGKLIEALIRLAEKNGETIRPAEQIGVIVPFRNQIGLVRRVLMELGVADAANMTIDTVECFQGSQRDFIFFTTTISRPYQLRILSQLQPIGKTLVDRKLNVALSRARRQLFLVGDLKLLSGSPIYKAFVEEAEGRM